jgi:hypothetical protein
LPTRTRAIDLTAANARARTAKAEAAWAVESIAPPPRAGSTERATLIEQPRRFGVFSVRSLLFVWVSSSLATLGYAYADLSLTPGLHQERGFSIHIDIARIGELWHWGGRLLNEGAMGLLVLNAIVVGGFLALLMLWLGQLLSRVLAVRRNASAAQTSTPTSVTYGRVPPPAG